MMAPTPKMRRRNKSAKMAPLLLIIVLFHTLLNSSVIIAAESSKQKAQDTHKCERLKKSLTYTQEAAPRDISAVLRVVVEKVNRDVEGVVDVEVGWTGGELHRVVGEHLVQCSVTRLLSSVKSEGSIANEDIHTDEHGRDVVIQCFHVPFTILDTDECVLAADHPMHHKCHEPSFCVNTIGSYECVCPSDDGRGGGGQEATAVESDYWLKLAQQKRTPWELSLNSTTETSCPNLPSTHNCCPVNAHNSEGVACRAAFRCPVDPCGGKGKEESLNDCAPNARCRRTASPLSRPNYKCQCPSGLMGNGHKCRKGIDPKPVPKVRYDGVTPTEETLRNNLYCGCNKPVVDACAGFPKCEGKHEICTVTSANTPECGCKPGFVKIEGYGCVDETPPVLKIKHDPTGDGINRLKQGDHYEEYAVDIVDDNAEEYARSLRITYSQPPPACLTKMGQFHVNYTVATPWTSPPYVRVTRTVIIEDINECELDVEKYETTCPELIPMCDIEAGAVCRNTEGSYTCQCPQFTSGDGFKHIMQYDSKGKIIDAPKGYAGGTGCRDTSKPVLEILGPNPKVLRVCRAGGLKGIMGGGTDDDEAEVQDLLEDQRGRYANDIKSMIKSSGGAELCATHTRPNPRPADCVRATDHTYKGPVNLSSRVTVGEPVQKSALEWRVPYSVSDDAGNDAKTAWRSIVVEEVCLTDLERKIRDEVLADKEREIDEAVKKALKLERKKARTTGSAIPASTVSSQQKECPKCQECICNNKQEGLTTQQCDAICDERMKAEAVKTCPAATSSAPTSSTTVVEDARSLVKNTYGFFSLLRTPGMIAVFLLAIVGIIFLFNAVRVALSGFYLRDMRYYTQEEEEHDRAMMGAVRYYHTPEHPSNRRPNGANSPHIPASARTTSPAPPRSTMLGGGAVGNGIFSPPENRMYGQQGNPAGTPRYSPGGGRLDDDRGIYQTMSPITPIRSNGSPAGNPGGRNAPYMR